MQEFRLKNLSRRCGLAKVSNPVDTGQPPAFRLDELESQEEEANDNQYLDKFHEPSYSRMRPGALYQSDHRPFPPWLKPAMEGIARGARSVATGTDRGPCQQCPYGTLEAVGDSLCYWFADSSPASS